MRLRIAPFFYCGTEASICHTSDYFTPDTSRFRRSQSRSLLYHNRQGRFLQLQRRDRATFHRFGLRHAGDETDPYFSNQAMRAIIPDLVRAGGVDRYLKTLLGNGWQGYSETWLIQVCGTPGRVTHMRIDPADGDGYSDC